MLNAQQTLDQYFPEMRWRCLSLAADLDRIARGKGAQIALTDPRLTQLKEALKLLLGDAPNRAEQVQLVFSDKTPPPERKSK
jgi:hypothetical protein